MSDTEDKSEEAPGFFAIIPLTILYDPSLPDGAKLLFAEITSLAKSRGYAWAKNAYFAKLHATSERTIISWIQRLRDAGHIKVFFEYFPNSKKVKERHIYPVIDPAQKRKETPDLVVKKTSPLEDLMVKNSSPPSGEENCLDNNISFNNIKAAAADLRDKTFPEVEKPPQKAATAAFDDDELEKLKTHFTHLNPKLAFDAAFYPKLLAFLHSHEVGLNFVSWMYELCVKKNPKNLSGYLFKVFFEERYVTLFEEASRPPPAPPVVLALCPICGHEHDRNDRACPSCGLERRAGEYDIAFKKAFMALPPEKQEEYTKEYERICGFGLGRAFESRNLIHALREEFGLPNLLSDSPKENMGVSPQSPGP